MSSTESRVAVAGPQGLGLEGETGLTKTMGTFARGENMKTKKHLDLEPRVKVSREPMAYGSAQLVGFAELVIGGAFVIRDIRILRVKKDAEESTFVAFPSRRMNGDEKKYYDVAFPITAEAYKEATGTILKAFEEAAAKA